MLEREAECRTCRFFDEPGDDWGLCRRYPPVVADPWNGREPADAGQGRFPLVEAAGWCGEQKPRAPGGEGVAVSY